MKPIVMVPLVTALLSGAAALAAPTGSQGLPGVPIGSLGVITELPPPQGSDQSRGSMINEAGQVTGRTSGGGQSGRLALKWVNGKVQVLPTPSIVDAARGQAIDGLGRVGGRISNPDDVNAACLWVGSKLLLLPRPAGSQFSTVTEMNQAGVMVGEGDNASGQTLPLLWVDNKLTILPGLPSDPAADANVTGINFRRQVSGTFFSEAPGPEPSTAVMWQNNRLTVLPPPPGLPFTEANDINNNGVICGHAHPEDIESDEVPVIWPNPRRVQLLPELPGALLTDAQGINNRNQVIGISLLDTKEEVGVLWSRGQVYNLLSLIPADSGWTILDPAGINDRGQIVGTGLHNDTVRAFILQLPNGI